MSIFLTRLFDGTTAGALYALVALALVMVYRSSATINFAQGEFALFTCYVAWWLTTRGMTPWLAVIPTVLVGFVLGAAAERTLIRPVRKREEHAVLIVALGLFTSLNGLAGWIWGSQPQVFPRLLPSGHDDYVTIGGARLHYDSMLVVVLLAAVVIAINLLLSRTSLGLQMRAVATSAESAALCGVNVGRILSLSWGMSAMIGSFAGMIIVPLLPPGQLSLSGFFKILIFASAAAILGGLDSFKGAVIGGIGLGIGMAMINGYATFLKGSFSLTIALVVILIVLLIRPTGLFGARRVERV